MVGVQLKPREESEDSYVATRVAQTRGSPEPCTRQGVNRKGRASRLRGRFSGHQGNGRHNPSPDSSQEATCISNDAVRQAQVPEMTPEPEAPNRRGRNSSDGPTSTVRRPTLRSRSRSRLRSKIEQLKKARQEREEREARQKQKRHGEPTPPPKTPARESPVLAPAVASREPQVARGGRSRSGARRQKRGRTRSCSRSSSPDNGKRGATTEARLQPAPGSWASDGAVPQQQGHPTQQQGHTTSYSAVAYSVSSSTPAYTHYHAAGDHTSAPSPRPPADGHTSAPCPRPPGNFTQAAASVKVVSLVPAPSQEAAPVLSARKPELVPAVRDTAAAAPPPGVWSMSDRFAPPGQNSHEISQSTGSLPLSFTHAIGGQAAVPVVYSGYGPPVPGYGYGPPAGMESQGLLSPRRVQDTSRSPEGDDRKLARGARKTRRPRQKKLQRSRSVSGEDHPDERKASGNAKKKPRMKLRKKEAPDPEPTVQDVPLMIGGIAGPLSQTQSFAGWETVLEDNVRRSFVSHRKKAFTASTLRDWFESLSSKVEWRRPKTKPRDDADEGHLMPRHACWMTSYPCTCAYEYGGTHWHPMHMPQWFLEITNRVCRACGIQDRPNSCKVNYYEDGSQAVSWHADDEPLFDSTRNDVLVISLSLGQGRRFELHPMDDPTSVTTMMLENGDLCTMEGLCQKHYRHRVPKEKVNIGPRINCTWRWIRKHQTTCPLLWDSKS